MSRRILPDRAAWLEARRTGLGGSDLPAVLGVSPWRSPLAVYADKLGLVEPSPETEPQRWGTILEPLVAVRYGEVTGRSLRAEPWTLRVGAEPWQLATLDRVIEVAEGKPAPAPLEIKTTAFARGDDWTEEPPVHVQVQVQWQLLVTGWEWASAAVLIGGSDFRWVDVARNDRFIGVMVERAREFWRRVDLRDPPAPTGLDREVLAALYPRETQTEAVVLPDAAVAWHRDRAEAVKAIKECEAVKAEAENRIKAALGEAARGVVPGLDVTYAWTTQERKGYTVAPSSARVLRVSERRKELTA